MSVVFDVCDRLGVGGRMGRWLAVDHVGWLVGYIHMLVRRLVRRTFDTPTPRA